MAHMASDRYSACELVVRVAKEMYAMVMECGIQQRQRVAGEVGTRLGQIAQESFVGYELDDEAEEAAAILLHMLLQICVFPSPVGDQIAPSQDYMRIVPLARPEHRTHMKKAISSFFTTDKTSPVKARGQCDTFLARLNQGEPNKKSHLDHITAGSKLPQPDDYPRHVSKNLFGELHKHALCLPAELKSHKSWLGKVKGSIAVHQSGLAHPIRLHLDGMPRMESKHVQFEVVVSAEDMSYWQHFLLGIPMQTRGLRGVVKFEGTSSDESEHDNRVSGLKQVSSDYFCQVLKHQLFARVKLNLVQGIGLVSLPPPTPLEMFLCPGQGLQLALAIQSYKLTDKDKIILAHAIAHSFWQFYGSDFMRHRWTSHDIWFMHEMDVQHNPKDQLALRAYISLDFDDELGVPEKPDDSMITHPYPHILGLGIILLEIGLTRPFKSMSHLPLTSRLNRDHGAARQLLSELEKAEWARPTHRDIFTRAVASCLDPSIFTASQEPKGNNIKRSTTAISSRLRYTTVNAGSDERRRKLYNEVVEPLAKLVNVAFKTDSKYISYLARCKEAEVCENRLQSQVASFHTGRTIVPREWLDNLKHISLHIMKLRRQKPGHKFSPVKIAILDTGCDAELPFFRDSSRANCIDGWKDFTANARGIDLDQTSMEDHYGHGSLMARLSMEAAPLAHIYIARVARDTRELPGRSEQIAQAIRWAGLEQEVDIISMSFGFPHDDDAISRAIEDVERDRNVIFLASAGNNAAYQREAFPARHRSVISIRATNCEGTFSATNPPIIDRIANFALGTFGDNLPSRISEEISARFGPRICHPGSSIATAVAAGIAASTIAYAEALSTVLPIPTEQSPVESLKKMDGMVRLLEKMAPDQTGHHRFVNPIWFWSEKADAWRAWAAMYDAASPLMYR